MNKNVLIIAGSIVVVGAIFGGILFYNHQGDLNLRSQQLELDKQKEQTKINEAKIDAEKASSDAFNRSLQYSSCVRQADTTKYNDFKINSQYETTDSDGNVIYHGDATIFARIESTAQEEKTRCSTMYQT